MYNLVIVAEEYKNPELSCVASVYGASETNQPKHERISLVRLAKIIGALSLTAGAFITYKAESKILSTDSGTIAVSAAMMPTKLPKQVKAMETNVVAVEEAIDKDLYQISASGLQLNRNTILTAGHVFRSANGKMFNDANWCSAFTSVSPRGFMRGVSQSSEFNYKSGSDLAVVRTRPLTKLNESIRPVRFARRTHLGEAVYFVNYQVTPNGDWRLPDPQNKAADQPAIYGGEIEGYDQNGYFNVPTVQSYGAYNDSSARVASSGGPVFNDHGELVGITVRVINSGPTLKAFNWLFDHVDLSAYGGNAQYTTAVVEPVNPNLLHQLSTNQQPFGPC